MANPPPSETLLATADLTSAVDTLALHLQAPPFQPEDCHALPGVGQQSVKLHIPHAQDTNR